MKIVTGVATATEKWKPLYEQKQLLYEKADSVMLRTRIEKFYFYNYEQIVLQNWLAEMEWFSICRNHGQSKQLFYTWFLTGIVT